MSISRLQCPVICPGFWLVKLNSWPAWLPVSGTMTVTRTVESGPIGLDSGASVFGLLGLGWKGLLLVFASA